MESFTKIFIDFTPLSSVLAFDMDPPGLADGWQDMEGHPKNVLKIKPISGIAQHRRSDTKTAQSRQRLSLSWLLKSHIYHQEKIRNSLLQGPGEELVLSLQLAKLAGPTCQTRPPRAGR